MCVCFLSVLAVLCTFMVAAASQGPSFQVHQRPSVVALMQLNASAEISCSSTGHQTSDLQGLSLWRKFKNGEQVFYQDRPVESGLTTLHPDFEGRITVTRSPVDCCTFTFQLSLLQVDDTDGYYCSWLFFNSITAERHDQNSNYTLVIVRERNPEEPCSRPGGKQLSRLFLGLSVVVCVVMFLIFVGALIWRCTLKKGKYDPHESSQEQEVLHHHNHRRRPPPPPSPLPHQHPHHQTQNHHHYHHQTQNHHHQTQNHHHQAQSHHHQAQSHHHQTQNHHHQAQSHHHQAQNHYHNHHPTQNHHHHHHQTEHHLNHLLSQHRSSQHRRHN